ncbi:MAG: hypothetical protein B0D92_07290 [Spirochaeta sp. LUC14_002_19_P3]|nr:MAG: hypothetical protein B0D92_07290 [Spirochaeta sp. LUC14_002_19_P3]
MFRFNKDIEYALIALVELSRLAADEILSARELSDRYLIPYKLLARILQKLGADGILNSLKGSQGGYSLALSPADVNLGRVIQAVRGTERIADCLSEDGNCVQENCGCTIKPIIEVFQNKWIHFVENTTLAEITQPEVKFIEGI